jgi:hypothetical protein
MMEVKGSPCRISGHLAATCTIRSHGNIRAINMILQDAVRTITAGIHVGHMRGEVGGDGTHPVPTNSSMASSNASESRTLRAAVIVWVVALGPHSS